MKIIIGKSILENRELKFNDKKVILRTEDDFSSIVLNTSSRIVEELSLKIDPLKKSVKNDEKDSSIVHVYDGKASEDYISAYLEYVQNKSEKSFRVIIGCLLLLYKYEYPQYTGENYRKIELSEAMQIAQYLIVNSDSGLLSEKDVVEYQSKMSEWNKNRLYNFSRGLYNAHPEMKCDKNRNNTIIKFDDEITVEDALFYISSDLMISKNEVFIEVLNHNIKYRLKASSFLEILKNKVELDKQIYYNGNHYRLSNISYFEGGESKTFESILTMRITAGGVRYPMPSIREMIIPNIKEII